MGFKEGEEAQDAVRKSVTYRILMEFVEQEIAEAEDRAYKDMLSLTSDIALRDYGGDEKLILQVVTTGMIVDAWLKVKNNRALHKKGDSQALRSQVKVDKEK